MAKAWSVGSPKVKRAGREGSTCSRLRRGVQLVRPCGVVHAWGWAGASRGPRGPGPPSAPCRPPSSRSRTPPDASAISLGPIFYGGPPLFRRRGSARGPVSGTELFPSRRRHFWREATQPPPADRLTDGPISEPMLRELSFPSDFFGYVNPQNSQSVSLRGMVSIKKLVLSDRTYWYINNNTVV